MTFMDKVYTLRTEVRSDGKTSYFISFTDGQGEFYDLEVSEAFYIEFRQMERKNRNLQQSDWRHQEASDLWDETLYNRAFRRRFLLYHEYDFNYRQIGEMEHCRPQSIMHSVTRAREKIKAEIEKYRAGQ